jgi:hypothetical protein
MEYNLDQIESRVKEKYENTMKWLNGLRKESVQANPELRKNYESYLGAELASSISAYSELDKVSEELGPVYRYKDGDCYFDYKGVRFTVADLRSMRVSERVKKETYFDICVVLIDRYRDDIWVYDLLPTYLCGSTSDEFDEFKPVHDLFIEAADEYLKKNPDAAEDRKIYEQEFENGTESESITD